MRGIRGDIDNTDKIVELYLNGRTPNEIGEYLETDPKKVRQIVEEKHLDMDMFLSRGDKIYNDFKKGIIIHDVATINRVTFLKCLEFIRMKASGTLDITSANKKAMADYELCPSYTYMKSKYGMSQAQVDKLYLKYGSKAKQEESPEEKREMEKRFGEHRRDVRSSTDIYQIVTRSVQCIVNHGRYNEIEPTCLKSVFLKKHPSSLIYAVCTHEIADITTIYIKGELSQWK